LYPLDTEELLLYNDNMNINIDVTRVTEPCSERVITVRVPLVDDIYLCIMVKARLWFLKWTQTFTLHLV